MKYSFTTVALVGAIFVTTSGPTPISSSPSSAAASMPSFSPDYTNVAGNFTAIAGSSPKTTPVASSSFDFSGFPTNFGLGPVVLQSGNAEPSNPASTSIVVTPTKTRVTGSATDDLFLGFTRNFGHGPAVQVKGYNHTNQPSNSTVQKLRVGLGVAPSDSSLDDTVSHPAYPDNRCKYYTIRWVCESWMRIDRWWNGERVYREHVSQEAYHTLPFHHASSIQMDFNSTNSSIVETPALNSSSNTAGAHH
ncbi:hypothetical protein V8E51_001939 [Hyaloscypha variabilis]